MTRTEPTADESAPPVGKANGWAWGICWLMFASTVLNYMDRQAMSLVGPQMKHEYGLRNVDFGWVLAAFSLSYALFQVPAGYLVDRWNVRLTYAGAVAWWSLAGMAAAFSPSLGALLALRACLGVGESFNWPCALRVTAAVLPPADRSLGNGIFNSGAAVGAVVTPIVVTLLTARFGWRIAFLCVGTLGFVWVALWLALIRGERRQLLDGRSLKQPAHEDLWESTAPKLSMLARSVFSGVVASALVIAGSAVWLGLSALWWGIAWLMIGTLLAAWVLPAPALKGADWAESLGEIVRIRRFWILVMVSISVNVCWHFLVNWLPTYLKEDRELTWFIVVVRHVSRSFSIKVDPKFLASGMLTAIPFLAADFGNLGGGALSRWLAGRGMSPARARLRVMTLCAFVITSGIWVGLVRNDTVVIGLISLMLMGTAAFMANYFSFAQEVAPRHTGLVVGILGGLGNLFAAGFLPIAGKVKDLTGGFAPIFVLTGLLPFLGVIALMTWEPSRDEAKSS